MGEDSYDIYDIETAFFNYDSDGSEQSEDSWQKRRQEWAKFKTYLETKRATEAEHSHGC